MECGCIGEELNAILRRRLETLSEKNEAKDSARDDLGFVYAVSWCVCDVGGNLFVLHSGHGFGN